MDGIKVGEAVARSLLGMVPHDGRAPQRPSKAQFAAAALAMAVVVLASNIPVQFPINDWLTWGAITYPVAFPVSELVNRAHGPAQARRVAWVGFAAAVAASLVLAPARIAVPQAPPFCCRNGWTLVCLTGCGMPPGGAPAGGHLCWLRCWTPPCSGALPLRAPKTPG